MSPLNLAVNRRQFVIGSAMLGAAMTASHATALTALAEAPVEDGAKIVPGTYVATTFGHNGPFEVTVEVADDASIADIVIGDNDETNFVGTWSMDQVRQTILDQQTPNVDTISGATFSTMALINGVRDALAQAGVDAEGLSPYEPEVPAYEDTQTQVVVVGAGSAGLAATMQAHELGLDVILVEQLGIIGGASGRAGYYVGGGTRFAAASGDIYSMEDFRATLVESNPDQPDRANLFGERAGESIDWFFGFGIDDVFYDKEGAYGKGTHWGDYGPIGGFMTYALVDALEAAGIDVRINTRVESLIVEDGAVCGVNVSSAGQTYAIRADAVVLATGGYSRNPDMVARYTPELSGYGSDSSMGADGSGMLMAEAAGAVLENMSDVFYYYGENVIYNGVPRNMTYPYLMHGIVVVNEQGERFIDELSYYAYETVEAFNAQTGRHGFALLTQTMFDDLAQPALDYAADLPQMYTECADLAEVAERFGIDAEALAQTIERYNGFVESGEDEDFHKMALGLTEKFGEGPFYVAEVAPCVHMTYGGIRTDEQMHALDATDNPIPGLYAAGECTHVMLNGIGTNTISLVEGRVAAEQVAESMS